MLSFFPADEVLVWGFDSELFFSNGCSTKVRDHSLFNYFTQSWDRRHEFISFSKDIWSDWRQKATIWIWTQHAKPINC